MSQLTYQKTMTAAYEGGHAEIETVIPVRNNSGAIIPWGRAVVFDAGAGTTDLAARLPSGSTDVILGALMYDHSHESAEATGLADDNMGSVVSHGQVWMFAEQAVTPADPVFVRYNAAGGTGTSPAVGQVRKDADTAKAVAATNARFRTSAAAGGLVLVEWNVP